MNIISKHYETIKKKDLDEYIHSLKKDNSDNEEDNSDGDENLVNSNVTT
jgi:hypothetical protein